MEQLKQEKFSQDEIVSFGRGSPEFLKTIHEYGLVIQEYFQENDEIYNGDPTQQNIMVIARVTDYIIAFCCK